MGFDLRELRTIELDGSLEWDTHAHNLMRAAADEIDSLRHLQPDVVRLVVAARAAAFDGNIQDEEVRKELDAASEAFASRVHWYDEPEEDDGEGQFTRTNPFGEKD